jgi:hypothetical protein
VQYIQIFGILHSLLYGRILPNSQILCSTILKLKTGTPVATSSPMSNNERITRRVKNGETARLRLAFVGAPLMRNSFHMIQRFRKERPICQVEITDLFGESYPECGG